MRRILFSLFVTLTLLVSCTTDHESAASKETVDVTFALDVDCIPSTRTISDGTGATQLMYGVFNDAGELIIGKAVKNDVTSLLSDAGYTMAISLPKGQSYQVVFWAQNPNCDAYTVSDDMQLTINYDGVNNDESRDAFFGVTEIFKVEGNRTVTVVLKRPFAQVNVGAFPFDLEHVKELGVDIAASSATIQGVANQLNMLTGEATGEVEVNYTLNAIPTEDLLVDVDEDGNSEVYSYLSMSYLLASASTTTHDMAFVFAEADGSCPADFNSGLDFVPIQRNWRTNIVGQILTGDIAFNVKIDPIYEGETINSGGLYYNFSEDTLIEDKYFAFNTAEAATFTSENNNKLTFNNVTFSGAVQYIAFGDYIKKDGKVVVPFVNELNNVVAKDMMITHSKGITNVEPIDYMAPLVFLRGESVINDCVFTGAYCRPDLPLYPDYWGDLHEVLPYDCGVPNDGVAVFNNCEISRMYAWSHVKITILNSHIEYIRCSTHNQTMKDSHLTIGEGSVIDTICVSSSTTAKRIKDENGKTHWDPNNMWSPSLIIKAGAEVKLLDMNGRSRYDSNGNLDVIIEDGAVIGEILNEGPNPTL